MSDARMSAYHAIESGDAVALKQALADGAHADMHDLGDSAARLGTTACLRALLDAGLNPDARDPQTQRSIAHAAAMTIDGSDDCLRLLLDRGADPKAVDRAGQNVAHAAAMAPSPRCLEAALRAGVDPFASDNLGFTIVHHASRKYSAACLRIAFDAGCDPWGDRHDRKPATASCYQQPMTRKAIAEHLNQCASRGPSPQLDVLIQQAASADACAVSNGKPDDCLVGLIAVIEASADAKPWRDASPEALASVDAALAVVAGDHAARTGELALLARVSALTASRAARIEDPAHLAVEAKADASRSAAALAFRVAAADAQQARAAAHVEQVDHAVATQVPHHHAAPAPPRSGRGR